MGKGIALTAVLAGGFIVGVGMGMSYGRNAKSNIGESVKTEFNGGVLTVQVNTVQALRAGLPEFLRG